MKDKAKKLKEKELSQFLVATWRKTVETLVSQVWEIWTVTQQLCLYYREKQKKERSLVQHISTFRDYWNQWLLIMMVEDNHLLCNVVVAICLKKHKRLPGNLETWKSTITLQCRADRFSSFQRTKFSWLLFFLCFQIRNPWASQVSQW